MDTKSKANFINSVATGQKLPCPNCNALNDAGDLFCFSCGTKLSNSDNPNSTFAPASNSKSGVKIEGNDAARQVQSNPSTPIFQMIQPEPEEISEEVSVFAEGLPDWDMVPPQVVVRRKKK